MRTLQYLVRISKDPNRDWRASVPDPPGCGATGKTIDSALRRIEGAIKCTCAECGWPASGYRGRGSGRKFAWMCKGLEDVEATQKGG